ncbi:hypothetical protein GNI_033880 [Gregarina niphandrodes]|uniref:Uncharacterized protein n=1 Tax=Gregarina niphandrodes TaxID=110365 RepID=A0A023BB41_GRENI|nr:hypothetical protein GNI_033880 [Gregarina niphandrodes]EZG78633.1 hypothetical protein GNI_033880 [Gregarina niphandrodes]|eukprot:XP_011129224.1 hypothetical protein GNI_033880 [Gregarina niphandrodes]
MEAVRKLLGRGSDEEVCQYIRNHWRPPSFSTRLDHSRAFCSAIREFAANEAALDTLLGLIVEEVRVSIGADVSAFDEATAQPASTKGDAMRTGEISSQGDVDQLVPLPPAMYESLLELYRIQSNPWRRCSVILEIVCLSLTRHLELIEYQESCLRGGRLQENCLQGGNRLDSEDEGSDQEPSSQRQGPGRDDGMALEVSGTPPESLHDGASAKRSLNLISKDTLEYFHVIGLSSLKKTISQMSYRGWLLEITVLTWKILYVMTSDERVGAANRRTIKAVLNNNLDNLLKDYSQQGGTTVSQLYTCLSHCIQLYDPETRLELVEKAYKLASIILSPEWDSKFGRKLHKKTICDFLGNHVDSILDLLLRDPDSIPTLILNCLMTLSSQPEITPSYCSSVSSSYKLLRTIFGHERYLRGNQNEGIVSHLLEIVKVHNLSEEELSLDKTFRALKLLLLLRPCIDENSLSDLFHVLEYQLQDYEEKIKSGQISKSWLLFRFVDVYFNYLIEYDDRLTSRLLYRLVLLLLQMEQATGLTSLLLKRIYRGYYEKELDAIDDVIMAVLLLYKNPYYTLSSFTTKGETGVVMEWKNSITQWQYLPIIESVNWKETIVRTGRSRKYEQEVRTGKQEDFGCWLLDKFGHCIVNGYRLLGSNADYTDVFSYDPSSTTITQLTQQTVQQTVITGSQFYATGSLYPVSQQTLGRGVAESLALSQTQASMDSHHRIIQMTDYTSRGLEIFGYDIIESINKIDFDEASCNCGYIYPLWFRILQDLKMELNCYHLVPLPSQLYTCVIQTCADALQGSTKRRVCDVWRQCMLLFNNLVRTIMYSIPLPLMIQEGLSEYKLGIYDEAETLSVTVANRTSKETDANNASVPQDDAGGNQPVDSQVGNIVAEEIGREEQRLLLLHLAYNDKLPIGHVRIQKGLNIEEFVIALKHRLIYIDTFSDYKSVAKKIVSYCHANGIQLLPQVTNNLKILSYFSTDHTSRAVTGTCDAVQLQTLQVQLSQATEDSTGQVMNDRRLFQLMFHSNEEDISNIKAGPNLTPLQIIEYLLTDQSLILGQTTIEALTEKILRDLSLNPERESAAKSSGGQSPSVGQFPPSGGPSSGGPSSGGPLEGDWKGKSESYRRKNHPAVLAHTLLSLLKLIDVNNCSPNANLRNAISKLIKDSQSPSDGAKGRGYHVYGLPLLIGMIQLRSIKKKAPLFSTGAVCYRASYLRQWIDLATAHDYLSYNIIACQDLACQDLTCQDLTHRGHAANTESAESSSPLGSNRLAPSELTGAQYSALGSRCSLSSRKNVVVFHTPCLHGLNEVQQLTELCPLVALNYLLSFNSGTDFVFWNDVSLTGWWALVCRAVGASGMHVKDVTTDAEMKMYEPGSDLRRHVGLSSSYAYKDANQPLYGRWAGVLWKYLVSQTFTNDRSAHNREKRPKWLEWDCGCRSSLCKLMNRTVIGIANKALVSIFVDVVGEERIIEHFQLKTTELMSLLQMDKFKSPAFVRHVIKQVLVGNRQSSSGVRQSLLGWIIERPEYGYLLKEVDEDRRTSTAQGPSQGATGLSASVGWSRVIQMILKASQRDSATIIGIHCEELANLTYHRSDKGAQLGLHHDLTLFRFVINHILAILDRGPLDEGVVGERISAQDSQRIVDRLLKYGCLLRGHHYTSDVQGYLPRTQHRVVFPDLYNSCAVKLPQMMAAVLAGGDSAGIPSILSTFMSLSSSARTTINVELLKHSVWREICANVGGNIGDLIILPTAHRCLVSPNYLDEIQVIIAKNLLRETWRAAAHACANVLEKLQSGYRKCLGGKNEPEQLINHVSHTATLYGLMDIAICRLGKENIIATQLDQNGSPTQNTSSQKQGGTSSTSGTIIKELVATIAKFSSALAVFSGSLGDEIDLPLSIQAVLKRQSSSDPVAASARSLAVIHPPKLVSLDEAESLLRLGIIWSRLHVGLSSLQARLISTLTNAILVTQGKPWKFIKKWVAPHLDAFMLATIGPELLWRIKGEPIYPPTKHVILDPTVVGHVSDGILEPMVTRSVHVWCPGFSLAPTRYSKREALYETADENEDSNATAEQSMTIDVREYTQLNASQGRTEQRGLRTKGSRRLANKELSISAMVNPIGRILLGNGRAVKGYFSHFSHCISAMIKACGEAGEDIVDDLCDVFASGANDAGPETSGRMGKEGLQDDYTLRIAQYMTAEHLDFSRRALNIICWVYVQLHISADANPDPVEYGTFLNLSASLRTKMLLEGLVLSGRIDLSKHLRYVTLSFRNANKMSSKLRFLIAQIPGMESYYDYRQNAAKQTDSGSGKFELDDLLNLLQVVVRLAPNPSGVTQRKNLRYIKGLILNTFKTVDRIGEAEIKFKPVVDLCLAMISKGKAVPYLFSAGVHVLSYLLRGVQLIEKDQFGTRLILSKSPLYLPEYAPPPAPSCAPPPPPALRVDSCTTLGPDNVANPELRCAHTCAHTFYAQAHTVAVRTYPPGFFSGALNLMISKLDEKGVGTSEVESVGFVVAASLALNSQRAVVVSTLRQKLAALEGAVGRKCVVYHELLSLFPAYFGDEEEERDQDLRLLVESSGDVLRRATILDESVRLSKAAANVAVQEALQVVYMILKVEAVYLAPSKLRPAVADTVTVSDSAPQWGLAWGILDAASLTPEALESQAVNSVFTLLDRYVSLLDLERLLTIPEINFRAFGQRITFKQLLILCFTHRLAAGYQDARLHEPALNLILNR